MSEANLEWVFCYADRLQHDTSVHEWDCDRFAETLVRCRHQPFTRHPISLRPDRLHYIQVCDVYNIMLEGKTLRQAVTEYMGYRYRRLENAFQDFLLEPRCQRRRQIPLPYNVWEYVIYYYYRNDPKQYFEIRIRLPLSILCTAVCAREHLSDAERIADNIAEDYVGEYIVFFDRVPSKGIELVAVLECDSRLEKGVWKARVEHMLLKAYSRHYYEGWYDVLA